MDILVIEDSTTDFYLIERALGPGFALSHSVSLQDALATASGRTFDLLILDLNIGDSSGFTTFEKARAALPGVPILVLSGTDDEALALRAVSQGAQDYVPKSRLLDSFPLDRAARYAVERHRAERRARHAELQCRSLLDNLPAAAFTCDEAGLITYFNAKAVEMWGRAPKLNDPSDRFSGSYHLRDRDGRPISHDQSYMARALRERRGFNGCELIIERPNGERVSTQVYVNPIENETHSVRGAVAVLIDITRERQIEKDLRQSERFARSIVNSLASHIAILDETGKIIAVNAAWQGFADANKLDAQAFGMNANYLSVWENSSSDKDGFARSAAAGIRSVLGGQQEEFALEYPCHTDASEKWFTMRVVPFEGDGPTRVVVSHEDITSRKNAERLAREHLGLREAVAAMEQVLGVVGHELRTPLAALRAITEFLTSDGAKGTAEADSFLHVISDEVDRMSDTVNNLLEAARLNSGRVKWNWSSVDVAGVVGEAVTSIEPLIGDRQVRILSSIDPAGIEMLGDVDAVRRLLINLLSNACKHTTHGTIQIIARPHADAGGAWVDLMVRDTGCGIPPAIAARLGEAFALNSGVVGKNHVSGTGLGVAICKGIAAAHGGHLLIDSVEGEGTTVTARLRADLRTAATGDTVLLNSSEGVAA